MIIKNALVSGKIKNILIENGIISDITENQIPGDCFDARGLRVIPGLIDVHTHGMMGFDTMDADFSSLCEAYAKCGTTSFLPTTMTMGYNALERVTNAKTDYSGANILGFHFEGPYISPKYKGAQDEKNIKIPDVNEFRHFKNIRMITVAPEVKNGLAFIKQVSGETVVSLGHTDCDYSTAIAAIENGASCLTHTFNAMPPMLHRAPGPIGAGAEKHIYAQIICDGLHVHKAAFLAAYRMFGPDRLCLISDSIRPAKLPDGEYESGGLPVFVKDNSIRLKSGVLAGSYSCLFDCVKKAIEFGIPETDAVKMATETPANLLGVKKGKLEKGYDADILVIDRDFSVKNVIIGGELFI